MAEGRATAGFQEGESDLYCLKTPYIVYLEDGSPAYLAQQHLLCVDTTNDNPGALPSTLIITKEWMPASNKRKPLVYKIGNFGEAYDPLAREPLSTRAWTLQERVLASRTLHCGSEQMFWECEECLVAEDGSRFADTFFTVSSIFRGQQIPPSYHGLPKQSKNFSFLDNLYHNVPRYGRWDRGWLALVEDYSRRKLTRAEDKLSALSGLAKLLAQRTGDGYLAWAMVVTLLKIYSGDFMLGRSI